MIRMTRVGVRCLSLLVGVWLLASAGCHGVTATSGGKLYAQNMPGTISGPPVILAVSPMEPTAVPGELLKLSVSARDPSGGALKFDWNTYTGILGSPVQVGNTSEVLWASVACVSAGKPEIRVTITNSAGVSTRLLFAVTWNGPICKNHYCQFKLEQSVLTFDLTGQEGGCTTEVPVFIPEGITLDGRGKLLRAVDPEGGTFIGPILLNYGAVAHVRNLKVQAQLKDACFGGAEGLRGILLQNASGSVEDSEVLDVRRNAGGTLSGCQEGTAIEVRNVPIEPSSKQGARRPVRLLRNKISGYQKAGIWVDGQVDVIVRDNAVTGSGPVLEIAQNGIQLGNGVTGQVMGNRISKHAYAGKGATALGILGLGGQDVIIQGNMLTDNDVGIRLEQANVDEGGSRARTRIQVLANTLQADAVTNGTPYQAGILDLSSGGNIIYSNTITGAGYVPTNLASRMEVTPVAVTAEAASKIVFLLPPQWTEVGPRNHRRSCSNGVIVQSQDANGNLSRPALAEFTLSASGAVGTNPTFYADPACEQEISKLNLSTPEAKAVFYINSFEEGEVTLTLSNGSLSGTLDLSIPPYTYL